MNSLFVNLIEDLFSDPRLDPLVATLTGYTPTVVRPKCPAQPQGDEFNEKVVIPGYTKEEVELDYSGGRLTIIAKNKELGDKVTSIYIPENIWDISNLECRLENGILYIKARRLKDKQVRKITIK